MSDTDRAVELFERACAARSGGRLDEAASLFLQSIEARPTAEAHTFLGWTYSASGRYADAIAECRKAIAVDPDFGNPYNDIGAYLVEMGRADEAVPWLRRATKAARYEPRHFPHLNLSRIYASRHDYVRAIRELDRALSFDPDCASARRARQELAARMN
ncbi:MAG TPA: tetratricopeptide repeat protein [Planctomycetota bacterium]|nr:tetratricopeptide repeat protein [Planctomycetota bacterium]